MRKLIYVIITIIVVIFVIRSCSDNEKKGSSIPKAVLNIVNKDDKHTVKLAISPEEIPAFTVADKDLYMIYNMDGSYIVQEFEDFKNDKKIDFQYEITLIEYGILSWYLD
ncbi:hypothetical protein [Fictibacillus arsenicus]|uniref:Uncharacterized protein n=1 Tax=Fictibacillus arsenicus TaxID=255247 RepID=A0A1V3G913_9BACL|nr:hypothetical protein [Fictibacillus arsenicus]OOE12767.1 hypothetical protein UN64_11965 [Fictibacillus arsenicus]